MNELMRIVLPACVAFLPLAAAAQEGGIPPHVAAKLGIAPELVKKVQDLAFDANDKVIGLEAELRRAQLALEREMRAEAPDEARAEKLVEAVGRAETAVRKNRIGLMVRVRKALGNELWQKLEALRAEERPPGHHGPPGGPGMGHPMGPPHQPPRPPGP